MGLVLFTICNLFIVGWVHERWKTNAIYCNLVIRIYSQTCVKDHL